jgi:hypothetical protein
MSKQTSEARQVSRENSEIAEARAIAWQRTKDGWIRVKPGDLAALRAAGEYEKMELASFPTAIIYHDNGDGRFKAIAFEVWRRPRPPRGINGLPPGDVREQRTPPAGHGDSLLSIDAFMRP